MCQIFINLFWHPSKLLTLLKTKYIWEIWKSAINSKEVKSSDLKIYFIHWILKPNWTPRAVWNVKLTKFCQIDGTYSFPNLPFSVFKKNHSKREGKETIWSFSDFLCCLHSNWITFWYHFFFGIFLPSKKKN